MITAWKWFKSLFTSNPQRFGKSINAFHRGWVVSKESIVNGKKTFRCPKRDGDWQADACFPHPDYWERRGKDLCCIYCGGWHPEQLLKHCSNVVANDGQKYSVEYVAGKGKIYVTRPGIANAGQGAIKAYICHIRLWGDEQKISKEEIKEIESQLNMAIKISNNSWVNKLKKIKS